MSNPNDPNDPAYYSLRGELPDPINQQYQGQWGDLISQLRNQMQGGQGPAQKAYQQGYQQNVMGEQALSHSGTAAGAGSMGDAMKATQGGQQFGMNQAQAQDQINAQSELAQALGQAQTGFYMPYQAGLQQWQLQNQQDQGKLQGFSSLLSAIGMIM